MLSPWQLERQVAHLLEGAAWEDDPEDPVLTGGAVVSADGPGNFLPNGPQVDGPEALDLPFALVTIASSKEDVDVPGRLDEVLVRVTVVAGGGGVAGASGDTDSHDSHGIKSTIGGERDATNGQGKSTGRGLDEVLDRLVEALGSDYRLNDSAHALQAVVEDRGPVIPVDGSQVVARTFDIRVFDAARARHYHPARRFRGTSAAGVVSLAWSAAPDRFDFVRYVVRRSAAGGSAPTSPTDGTAVTLASDDATTATVNGLTVGQTYAFSIFAAYDETSETPTTPDRYSARATCSITVA